MREDGCVTTHSTQTQQQQQQRPCFMNGSSRPHQHLCTRQRDNNSRKRPSGIKAGGFSLVIGTLRGREVGGGDTLSSTMFTEATCASFYEAIKVQQEERFFHCAQISRSTFSDHAHAHTHTSPIKAAVTLTDGSQTIRTMWRPPPPCGSHLTADPVSLLSASQVFP